MKSMPFFHFAASFISINTNALHLWDCTLPKTILSFFKFTIIFSKKSLHLDKCVLYYVSSGV